MNFLYGIGIKLSWLFLRVLALFKPKIRAFIKGRKLPLSKRLPHQPVWVHAASAGEFEQAKPIIESIKKRNPEEAILLTFFSPSGFNLYKDYELADSVLYLPYEHKADISRFLNHFNPKCLLLIKYEFWRNLLQQCSKYKIPLYSISSIFREEQIYFKGPFRRFFQRPLLHVDRFFVQDETSLSLLNQIGIKEAEIIGDTRFDRVIKIAENSKEVTFLQEYTANHKILVAGSTWPEDEKLLCQIINELTPEWKLILAPHDISATRLNSASKTFEAQPYQFYSRLKLENLGESSVLIIDNLGMLKRIYKYADVSYIGGGFGKGIHNILEAAVYGTPVFHGPNYTRFKEAVDLLEQGASVVTKGPESTSETMKILVNPEKLEKMGAKAKDYVYRNMGATLKVMTKLETDEIF